MSSTAVLTCRQHGCSLTVLWLTNGSNMLVCPMCNSTVAAQSLQPMPDPYPYKGSLEQRWRYAEANVEMLADALVELFDYVQECLDPEHVDHVDKYLCWDAVRAGELRAFLAERKGAT